MFPPGPFAKALSDEHSLGTRIGGTALSAGGMSGGQGAPQPNSLGALHFFLAFAVMAVWGSNFVVIKLGLDTLPPFLFVALRFTLAFVPQALFLPRPQVPWRNLAAFGLLIGVGQFGLLFLAMRADISPGLASLVVQTQVVFTIALSVLIARERLKLVQIAAIALAGAGLVVIGLGANGSATPLGLGLVLLAALSWAAGNMVVRSAGSVPMLSYVVWSSLFPAPVLFLISFLVEGPAEIAAALSAAGAGTWLAVVWQSVGNTMFGYGVWGFLLGRYPAATVTPMALLVPVFGLGTSAVVLGEALPHWKLAGAGLIIAGLALGLIRRPRRTVAAEPV